jgi:type IV secretory pathway VirJ component
VLPFMINGLSQETANKINLAVLIGAGHEATFEFHLSYWLGGSPPEKSIHHILPEVKKMKGTKILCLYGKDEEDSLCRDLDKHSAQIVLLKGGHHFGGDYSSIADIILKEKE